MIVFGQRKYAFILAVWSTPFCNGRIPILNAKLSNDRLFIPISNLSFLHFHVICCGLEWNSEPFLINFTKT